MKPHRICWEEFHQHEASPKPLSKDKHQNHPEENQKATRFRAYGRLLPRSPAQEMCRAAEYCQGARAQSKEYGRRYRNSPSRQKQMKWKVNSAK